MFLGDLFEGDVSSLVGFLSTVESWMKVKDEKVTGYILLSKGFTMVVFSVCSISTVFTGSQGPLHLFDFSDF